MFHRAAWRRPRALPLAGIAVFVLAGSWGATVASHQVKSQVPRSQVKAAAQKTILRIGFPLPDHDHRWVVNYEIVGPESIDFQWTTRETGVAAARWVVTNKPYGTAGTSIVASGPVPPNVMPPPDKPGMFSINFGAFIPKQAPAKDYVIKYYVVLIPIDAQKNDLEASSTAIVAYRAPEAPTVFGEDLGTLPWAQAVLEKAYQALKGEHGLGDAAGAVKMGPNIPAFRRYRTATGYEASIEVTGSDAAPIIYLCVPAFYVDTPIAYHWFKYTINRNNGRVVAAIDGDQYAPQSFEPDMMGNTDAFTHDTSAAGGVHWAPILIDEDRGAGISIEQIHTRYQIARDGATGLVNTLKQMVLGQDISERAQKMWQHVTVRGKLIQGHFTDGDWGPDHTMDYNDGEDTPMGPFYEIHDPQAWPGLDWDMAVRPDKPYNYLQDVALADVRVEIEHFALQTGDPGYVYENSDDPVSYWPTTGHYLQATGRWVIDNGHSYTEIHPPELLAVTYLRTYGSATAVTATGAWLGGELTFVANPPPRPSADARLRWGIYRLDGGQGYDRQDNAELIMEPQGPADNPNHVLCRLRQTAPATLILYDNGVVGMTRTRGLTCVVKAWWNATTATATGTVNDGAKPALGAFVFYRDESIPRSPWRAVRVNNQGTFSIPELAIGKPYRFVVAGSGWYFPLGRVTKTLTGTDTPMNFVGNRVRNAGVPAALGTFTQYGRNRSVSLARPGAPPPRPRTAAAQRAAAGAIQPSLGTSGTSLVGENAAMQTIQSILVSLDEPSDVYGVAQNGLGYAERGTVYFRLQGLAGPDGQPTTDLKSAYSVDTSGPAPTITVNGTPSTGVAGARIRVRMLLGNEWTGYRTAASVDSVTGYNGLARLRFIAGSSVEEMTLDVEVLENPYNPWFLPRVRGSVHLFYPSSSLGGLVYPYRLEVNSFDAGTLKAGQMRTARAASEEDRRLMRTLSRTEGAQSARGKRPIAAAKPKKLKVVK